MVTTPRIFAAVELRERRLWRRSSHAEGLVEHAREGVGGVERNRGEHGVDLVMEELCGELAVGVVELLPGEDADAGFGESGDEALVEALGLVSGEGVEAVAEAVHALVLGEAAFVGLLLEAEVFFELLEDACDADFDELVKVGGGDGEELEALEKGIGGVVGFFEDALVEEEPGFVAIEVAGVGAGLGGSEDSRCGGFARGGFFRGGGGALRGHGVMRVNQRVGFDDERSPQRWLRAWGGDGFLG